MPTDDTSLANGCSAVEPSSACNSALPRFGVRHLIAWMAAVAMATCFNHWAFRIDMGRFGPFDATYIIVSDVSSGALLLVLASLLLWRIRGRRISWQPGHLLALVAILDRAGDIASALVYTRAHEAQYFVRRAFWLSPFFFELVREGLLIYLALRSRETWRWRLAYAFTALAAVGPVDWPLVPRTVFAVAPMVLIPFALLGDTKTEVRRDWAHWLGACACLADMFLGLVIKVRLLTM